MLRSDTKATEFGHLTSIDMELDSVILEIFYLACLAFEYGPSAGKIYALDYGVEVKKTSYQNPFDIVGLFKNVSKKTAEFVLARTVFYEEEKAIRRAKADEKHQSVISKKLDNVDKALKLRQKMIKHGIDPDEAIQLVGGLLADQRAKLLLPGPD